MEGPFRAESQMRRLSEMGIRPRVLVRRPHRASLLAPYEVEPIQGDLLSTETLKRAVEGVDTVFHLGGRASFESYRRLRPTIVEATAELTIDGHRTERFDDMLGMGAPAASAYSIHAGDQLYAMLCSADQAPLDRWLSIAETITVP